MREFRAFRPTALDCLEERVALSHAPTTHAASAHLHRHVAAMHSQIPQTLVVSSQALAGNTGLTGAVGSGPTVIGGVSLPLSSLGGSSLTVDGANGRFGLPVSRGLNARGRHNARASARGTLSRRGALLPFLAGTALGAAASTGSGAFLTGGGISSPIVAGTAGGVGFLTGGGISSPIVLGPLTFGSTGTSGPVLDVGQTFGPGFGQDGSFGAGGPILF